MPVLADRTACYVLLASLLLLVAKYRGGQLMCKAGTAAMLTRSCGLPLLAVE